MPEKSRQESTANELLRQVLNVLRGVWHRRWIGLGVAWIAAIVFVGIAFRIPERYEATARVYVDTETLLRPLLQGLSIQPNLDQQVAMMSRTLISRPNVEKLVRMADLDVRTGTTASRDELIDGVMKRIQLSGNASANLYTISYRDTNPSEARKVVQSLLSIFVESSLVDKRQDTRAAVKFIDDQIKQYEQNLRNAEDRVKQFRLKYLGVAGQSGPDYFSRLEKVKEDLDSARLDLKAAEDSRDAYKRELADEPPQLVPDSPAALAPAVPDIDKRLAVMRAELDGLRRKFTDDHPDVVGTKRIIEQLEQERQQKIDELKAKAAQEGRRQTGGDTNPVAQQLKVSLAESEANIASLRARVRSYEAQYEQLKASARLVPQVEAEYAQLTRDYDIQKKTYESLLARRQSATLGEGVQDAGGTSFRVIDPPRVLPDPVPPTRIMLVGIALAAALGAGILASFVASELMPTFHDARVLRVVSERPVLGMVTMQPNRALVTARRKSNLLFAGGTAALFAASAGVLAFLFLIGRVA